MGRIASAPEAISSNPLRRILDDVVAEPRAGSFPPGPGRGSVARARRMAHDPLSILLPLYERYGPIFSIRLLHSRVVFMLGPEANHYVTVSHPGNFTWRESSFGDMIPLLGDGLLTTDGALPRPRAADHDARLSPRPDRGRRSTTMAGETAAALARLEPGSIVDVYEWTRNLAMRIAMRALLGLDPDDGGQGAEAAHHFERALGFYGIDYPLRLLRGPVRHGDDWSRRGRSSTGSSTRRSPSAGGGPTPAATTSSAS